MGILRKKESYVTKGNRLISEGRTPAAQQEMIDGLNDYQNRLIKALNGYPTDDTALVVTALRTMADDLERQQPQCRPLLKWIKTNMILPKIEHTQKFERTKKR